MIQVNLFVGSGQVETQMQRTDTGETPRVPPGGGGGMCVPPCVTCLASGELWEETELSGAAMTWGGGGVVCEGGREVQEGYIHMPH